MKPISNKQKRGFKELTIVDILDSFWYWATVLVSNVLYMRSRSSILPNLSLYLAVTILLSSIAIFIILYKQSQRNKELLPCWTLPGFTFLLSYHLSITLFTFLFYVNIVYSKDSPLAVITCPVISAYNGRNPSVRYRFQATDCTLYCSRNIISSVGNIKEQPQNFKVVLNVRKGLFGTYVIQDSKIL